jgi:cell division transport system permease protein
MKNAFRPGISPGLVFTMFAALFSLGIFVLLLLAGKGIERILKEEFEVQVFLDKEISSAQAAAAGKALLQSGYVARDMSGKAYLNFVSRKQAGDAFIKETGEDFYQFLGENPLRDAYHFRIRENFISRSALLDMKTKLLKIPGVFEVQYMENLADSLEKNIRNISMVVLSVAAVLMLSLIWLIRSAIQASLHSGRFFIRSMELVGASSWFIRRPYVMAIGIGGMLGGILAAAASAGCIFLLMQQLPDLSGLLPVSTTLMIISALIPLGFLLGFIPALLGIRAYQSRKLGDLHSY